MGHMISENDNIAHSWSGWWLWWWWALHDDWRPPWQPCDTRRPPVDITLAGGGGRCQKQKRTRGVTTKTRANWETGIWVCAHVAATRSDNSNSRENKTKTKTKTKTLTSQTRHDKFLRPRPKHKKMLWKKGVLEKILDLWIENICKYTYVCNCAMYTTWLYHGRPFACYFGPKPGSWGRLEI